MDKERDIELHSIRHIMSIENGRAFIYRCLQHCGTYDMLFHENVSKHAYHSGMRDHGVWLENEVKEADYDLFLKMMKENEDA